ncbi:MAG: YihY/virulence factor BrkB family protein [Candidatus Cloacimonadaceae bacterium]|jgi:membrane protein
MKLQKGQSFFVALAKAIYSKICNVYDVLTTPEKLKQVLQNAWNFVKVFYKRVTNDGVLKESASLTYITLLGFVPFITFVFMIVPDLPFLNVKDKIREILAANMVPGSASAIMGYLDDFVKNRTAFNIVSFVILIVSSYSLFRNIRNAFDRILNVRMANSQDLISQLIKFLGTLIFGFFIMVVLFSASSLPVISLIFNLPILKQISYFLPFVVQFLGISLLYSLIPTIRVGRKAVMQGAFWTSVVWALVKNLFDIYIYNLTSIQAVYGVMSALPIFLMWIYFNWVIIMGGIVLVSVLDKKGEVEDLVEEPRKTVRLTLELYSDDNLNRRLEGLVDKKDLLEVLKEDLEKED